MKNNTFKIMIVDDNEAVLEAASAGIELEGFIGITALNGQKALELISKEKPDFILLDINLPDINGFDICKNVKNNNETADIPIVMMTGDKTIDIDKGFAVGADDCIIKPIDLKDIIIRIKKLVHKKYNILVIEDDRQVCSVISKVIEKSHSDYTILYDGVKVFDVIKESRPDLIILDISLPNGPDGIELCKKIKENSAYTNIPIIMLTANEYSDSIEKCFTYGADDYIFKPFNVSDLLIRIRKYLGHFEKVDK